MACDELNASGPFVEIDAPSNAPPMSTILTIQCTAILTNVSQSSWCMVVHQTPTIVNCRSRIIIICLPMPVPNSQLPLNPTFGFESQIVPPEWSKHTNPPWPGIYLIFMHSCVFEVKQGKT